MNRKARRILGGMSAAGLILAGSLPAMADQKAGKTCSCGKGKAKTANAKDNKAADTKKVDQSAAKKVPPADAKAKAASTKSK
jgi:hypothetical protein